MTTNNKIVRIFTLPQQFPCGPQSSCCGPIGQSEEEIKNLEVAIKKELSLETEVISLETGVINAESKDEMKKYLPTVRLLNSLGPMALPIITLDHEVVSVGNPTPEEAISAIKEREKLS